MCHNGDFDFYTIGSRTCATRARARDTRTHTRATHARTHARTRQAHLRGASRVIALRGIAGHRAASLCVESRGIARHRRSGGCAVQAAFARGDARDTTIVRRYDLGAIQEWLPRATGHPMPTSVDSCAVAGMIDLLRAQGSWFHAARYAFHFGAFAASEETRTTLAYEIPPHEAFTAAAQVNEPSSCVVCESPPCVICMSFCKTTGTRRARSSCWYHGSRVSRGCFCFEPRNARHPNPNNGRGCYSRDSE